MGDKGPVIWGFVSATGLVALFKATLIALRSSGAIHADDVAINDWVNVADLGFPILIGTVAAIWTARNVTSLHNPTDTDGTRLSRPNDVPAIKEQESIKKAIFQERKV